MKEESNQSPANTASSYVRQKMKTCFFAIGLCLLTPVGVQAGAANDEPVLLPPVVVRAHSDAKLFIISFETKSLLPFSKVTRAYFKKVFPGPIAEAGIKDGDELLRMGGVDVQTLTAASMWLRGRRTRQYGTREEFVIRTSSGQTRSVVVIYDLTEQKPNKAP